jgi:hypothetical protein
VSRKKKPRLLGGRLLIGVQSIYRGPISKINYFGAMHCGSAVSRIPALFSQVTGQAFHVNPELLWLQITCQLFVLLYLPFVRDLPSIQIESRPARLVMVVTDF